MTIREAGKGIVTNRKRICSYRIGFINSDGREDETELDVCNLAELEALSIVMAGRMKQNWMCVILLSWKKCIRIFVKRMDSGRIPLSMWSGKIKRRHRGTGACFNKEHR